MNWEQLAGQPTVQRVLVNQIRQGSFSHAYLFTGPAGTGKRSAAEVLAAALLCEAEEPPCGQCLACQQAERGTHPDLRWVQPDGTSLKLAQIKALLAEAALTPNSARYRVFIVEEAEKLTPEAANALLLILEEPPPFDIFILTAAGPVLPTIESRCQVLRFQRRASHAFSVSPQQREQALDFLQRLLQAPLVDRAGYVIELDAADLDLDGFLAALLALYRDLFVWRATGRQGSSEIETLDRLARQQRRDPAAICEYIIDVQRRLAHSANRKLILEQLCYHL
ncbi:MAG: ATP-binding protein [Bacillota bacterium]|jgi:DNA polymerase III delta' subunit